MKISIEQALGNEVRKARGSLRKSQESLAFDAEIHRTYLGMIERGQKSPTLTVILRLARALNIKASELVRRAESHSEKLSSSK
jgi:transcriptional regulator with XRE-family HTH domain